MINWDEIKNNIGELNQQNGINTKMSPIDNKPLNNELIMCLFCNKINLKYRFESYYEVSFIEYATRIFDSVLGDDYIDSSDELKTKMVCKTICESSPEGTEIPITQKNSENSEESGEKENFENDKLNNYFEVARKDPLIKTYIDSIKNVILTQLKISVKKNPDIIKDISRENNLDITKNDIYEFVVDKIDTNLLLISALENLDMRKYKILSKMLYNIDNDGYKYLDYAKESIINSNKNISLDKMVFGFDLPKKFNITENFSSSNNLYLNWVLIIIILLLIIFMSSRT